VPPLPRLLFRSIGACLTTSKAWLIPASAVAIACLASFSSRLIRSSVLASLERTMPMAIMTVMRTRMITSAMPRSRFRRGRVIERCMVIVLEPLFRVRAA